MTVYLRPLSEVDFGEFTEAFNAAYSDYFVPIRMTRPAFRALFERDDIAPDASVVAIEDGKIVGTGLLGVRDRAAWIGGMGVIPGRRRNGTGRLMMDHLIAQARARNLEAIDLEVIEENRPAWQLYRSLGFQQRRHLLMLDRQPEPVSDILPNCPLRELDAFDIVAQYDDYHPVPNCWQRGTRSLEGMATSLLGWSLDDHDNERAQAYALGYADEAAIRLIDLCATPSADALRATACLLAALHRAYPDAPANAFNIADNDPVLPAFEALGYTVSLRQFEMQLLL